MPRRRSKPRHNEELTRTVIGITPEFEIKIVHNPIMFGPHLCGLCGREYLGLWLEGEHFARVTKINSIPYPGLSAFGADPRNGDILIAD